MPGRRTFLQTSALALLGATGACSGSGSLTRRLFGESAPSSLGVVTPAEARATRVLDRLAFGPTRELVERVAREGLEAFVESQLEPSTIDDARCDRRLRRVESLALDAEDLYALTEDEALADLRRGTILRAVYSERQLLERIVELWTDHFSIYGEKEGCGRLLVVHDREVIRKNALGRFRDLVLAVTTSPAMLVYLDGAASEATRPNENHARELLELHTLGVAGGYTQADVREAARCLTGWRLRAHWRPGRPAFEPALHDDGPKHLLGGRVDAGGGIADVERVVDVACAHPTTAERIARLVCSAFVAESPEPSVVAAVARRFVESGGDIRAMLRETIRSSDLAASPPRLKRPFSFAVSAIRALGGDTDGGKGIQAALRAMSHVPFAWPTPDGYPRESNRWERSLPTRWSFSLALASGQVKGTTVDAALAGNIPSAGIALFGRELDPVERNALEGVEGNAEGLAALLASPEFQYR